jgi:hypothetical protein
MQQDGFLELLELVDPEGQGPGCSIVEQLKLTGECVGDVKLVLP